MISSSYSSYSASTKVFFAGVVVTAVVATAIGILGLCHAFHPGPPLSKFGFKVMTIVGGSVSASALLIRITHTWCHKLEKETPVISTPVKKPIPISTTFRNEVWHLAAHCPRLQAKLAQAGHHGKMTDELGFIFTACYTIVSDIDAIMDLDNTKTQKNSLTLIQSMRYQAFFISEHAEKLKELAQKNGIENCVLPFLKSLKENLFDPMIDVCLAKELCPFLERSYDLVQQGNKDIRNIIELVGLECNRNKPLNFRQIYILKEFISGTKLNASHNKKI